MDFVAAKSTNNYLLRFFSIFLRMKNAVYFFVIYFDIDLLEISNVAVVKTKK